MDRKRKRDQRVAALVDRIEGAFAKASDIHQD
jgi:hypothetical protein